MLFLCLLKSIPTTAVILSVILIQTEFSEICVATGSIDGFFFFFCSLPAVVIDFLSRTSKPASPNCFSLSI